MLDFGQFLSLRDLSLEKWLGFEVTDSEFIINENKNPMKEIESSFNIFVFSFNRGEHLRNCIASIEICSPDSKVIIFDDNSSDIKTKQDLIFLKKSFEVIFAENSKNEDFKTGSLYRNMNAALKIAIERNFDRILFIQDDMQFVRSISKFDHEIIDSYFNLNENTIQLQPCFRNLLSVSKANYTTELDKSGFARFKMLPQQEGKDNFSAVGVFDVKRFIKYMGKFECNEITNSNLARYHGLRMGLSIFPFMHWTPYPISHRGKKRGFFHKIVESFGGADFHPIDVMGKLDTKNFMSRTDQNLCAIEDYCNSRKILRGLPWAAGGGEYMLLARGGIPAKIFNALKKFKYLIVGRRT